MSALSPEKEKHKREVVAAILGAIQDKNKLAATLFRQRLTSLIAAEMAMNLTVAELQLESQPLNFTLRRIVDEATKRNVKQMNRLSPQEFAEEFYRIGDTAVKQGVPFMDLLNLTLGMEWKIPSGS